MKTYLLLLMFLLLAPCIAQAQEPPYDTPAADLAPGDSLVKAARYQQVVLVPGASADDLYARAREWVALTFEDVHQVLQLEDGKRHLLIGSGYTLAHSRRPNGTIKNAVPLWFSFRLETREGRYRLELTDFGSVRQFSSGQYASAGIAYWLADSHATRAASNRHSEPGQSMAVLLGDGSPRAIKQVKDALDGATADLFASLRQVVLAVPATW